MTYLKPTPTHPLRDEVIRLLDKLGTSQDQVATTLVDLGITGQIAEADRCPVANYLYLHTGQRLHVGPACVTEDEWVTDASVVASLPDAVSDFIGDFDMERYPELITEDPS